MGHSGLDERFISTPCSISMGLERFRYQVGVAPRDAPEAVFVLPDPLRSLPRRIIITYQGADCPPYCRHSQVLAEKEQEKEGGLVGGAGSAWKDLAGLSQCSSRSLQSPWEARAGPEARLSSACPLVQADPGDAAPPSLCGRRASQG